MLFHVTAEDHIRVLDENGRGDGNPENTFASEKEWEKLATAWPMKRLIAIWNGLPGVAPVARFTDRKAAIRRIWRAVQPHAEQPAKPARGA